MPVFCWLNNILHGNFLFYRFAFSPVHMTTFLSLETAPQSSSQRTLWNSLWCFVKPPIPLRLLKYSIPISTAAHSPCGVQDGLPCTAMAWRVKATRTAGWSDVLVGQIKCQPIIGLMSKLHICTFLLLEVRFFSPKALLYILWIVYRTCQEIRNIKQVTKSAMNREFIVINQYAQPCNCSELFCSIIILLPPCSHSVML